MIMALRILAAEAEAIRDHGCREFPNECCGFLLGRIEGQVRHVFRVDPAFNESLELARNNRYAITPEQAFAADRKARRLGLDIVGFYHSHPNAPARPSNCDLEFASWPDYSYIILSVDEGEPAEMKSWVLAEDRGRFFEETVMIVQDACEFGELLET